MLFSAQQTIFPRPVLLQQTAMRRRTSSKCADLPAKGQLPRVRPVSSYRKRVSVTVCFYSCKNTHTRAEGENWRTSPAQRLQTPTLHLIPILPSFTSPSSCFHSPSVLLLRSKHLKTILRGNLNGSPALLVIKWSQQTNYPPDCAQSWQIGAARSFRTLANAK